MICPNCGTANESDALFCGNCGTDLRKAGLKNESDTLGSYTPNGAQAQPAAQKPISKWVFVIAAEAALLIFGIFVLRGLFGDINAPERVAEDYFVHVANGDWEAAYDDLDIAGIEEADSSFINKEMYKKGQAQTSLGIVSNYQVGQGTSGLSDLDGLLDGLDEGSGALGKTVRIDYRVKGDTENSAYTVSLNNPAKNQWKVSASDLLCKNYTLIVLKGAGVSVDGIDLGEDCFVESGDYTDTYAIPYIFYGAHEVKVTMEDMEEVNETVLVDYDSAEYYCDSMKVKTEVLDTLIQKAGENMQQIYNSAVAGKNLKTMESLFTTNEEDLEYINEAYENLLSGINEGSSQVQKINFYNIEAQAYPDSMRVEISFDYKIDYTYEDWWSGGMENDTYEGSSNSSMTFVKQNGNWVQTNLGCDTLYY